MSGPRDRLTEAQLALVLLTRLPAGRLPEACPKTSTAAWAFPLAGALVGAISGGVFLAAGLILPALPAALLAVAAGVLVTGGLHEDGLADVADGFGGGSTREDKLAIMRDSRIGSYGVIALVLVLGLIGSAIAGVAPTARSFVLFIAVGAISRAAMVLPMMLLPPAREDGLGRGADLGPGWRFWVALLLAVVAGVCAAPMLLAVAGVTALLMLWVAGKQIGGQTGDVLGATQKLVECACWLAVVAQVSAS